MALRTFSAIAALLILFLSHGSAAELDSFRLPEYSDDPAPPPPRRRHEVDKLLADAGELRPQRRMLRVLLVAGPKDHGKGEHDYPAWQNVWSGLLAKSPLTSVATAWEFPSAEQFDQADVAVFYQRGRWDRDREKAIDAFLARGGGLVYIHWAVDGRGGEAEFAKRIGLASLGGSIRYRHGPLEVDFTPGREHPIARNFSSIRWVDESYWMLTGEPSRITLLGSAIEDDAPQPQFWAMDHQPGRVFVSIPGHYMWTFDDPAFRILLLRGIAWTAERDVDRFNELATLDARVE